MTEVNGWNAGKNRIMTFTGKFVNPLSLTEQDVCIEDIAHALAMKCRYSGHCKKFYSVAEHSIYVSLMVPDNLALAALLHDAPEAYLCDVAGPIKANFPDFMKYEEGLHEQINLAFDLDLNAQDHPAIKAADKAILWLEVNQLMKNTDTYFREIGCWNWQLAESYFLRRFKELTSTAPLQQQPYAGRPAQGFSSDWNVLLSPGLPSPSLLSLGSDPNLSQKSCGQHCNEGPSESPAIEDLILNHRTSSARNH